MRARGRLAIHAAPGPIAAVALAVALVGLAGGLPLLEVPGLELGLCVAGIAAAALAPAVGVAATRRAREGTSGPAPVLRPFASTAGVTLLLVALTYAASVVRATLATPCTPWGSAALFALVAAPSALLASAVAVAATVVARGRRAWAALLYAGVALASLAATAAEAYLGPAAFAHDHLFGVWPGPIYDEALAVDARLVLFRVATLAWTAVALGIATAVARARAAHRPVAAGAVVAGALAVAVVARLAGGAAPTRGDLARQLGAVRAGPRCVVHVAWERGPAAAERALRDCEYDADAVARTLGLARPPRATVWIYRSPEEKRRLVGAGHTSYTKPWLAEIHVHDEGVPHPLLRHELVHALASSVARGPLGVPAHDVARVNLGLVEGLAVALEVPSGDFGVHAWARAMRDQGRLPPLASLLGGARFFGTPPARAYVAAGSFLRWLIDARGPGAALRAYRDDDVARGAAAPVPQLEREWNAFLDGVAVSPQLAAAAAARFARGSLFARACVREVASLERDAADLAARHRTREAEERARRAAALTGDPDPLRLAVSGWRGAGDLGRAEEIAREALARAGASGHDALRSALLLDVGDLRLRRGDRSGAAAEYRHALALAPGSTQARALHARLAAAADPALASATVPWLLSIGDPAVALARVAGSRDPLARYLLARAQLLRGAPRSALRTMESVDVAALPAPSLVEEAHRMHADALCGAGGWDDGIAAWRALAAVDATDGARDRAADAARRCAFERDAYGEPVAEDADWGQPR